METRKDITYLQLTSYGIVTEIFLIMLQFAVLGIYSYLHPQAEPIFTTEYMMEVGFYVFQGAGFFINTILAYFLLKRIHRFHIGKLLTFLIGEGILEFIFYMAIPANYQGVFLYSILDKIIAVAAGGVIYYYLVRKSKKNQLAKKESDIRA